MSGVFEALSEPARRLILEALAAGEQPAGQLVTALQACHLRISQPAVSQHLKVLREANLVSVRAAGTRRLYAVNHAGLAEAQAWLAWLASPAEPFAQQLDALATEIARGRRSRPRDAGAARPAAQPPGEARSQPA